MARQSSYQSIIASGYALPIATLLEHVGPGQGVNQVQTSIYEHSYSAAIIVLTVVMLESFLNVSKFHANSSEKKIREYYKKAFPGSKYQDELVELFIVR